MNGFSPDRRPQQLAQMLAAQERNTSLYSPPGQRDMAMRQVPGLGYSQPTPNAAPGVPPQAMNFTGPVTTPQPGITGSRGIMGGMGRPMGGMNRPPMSPQIGGQMQRPRGPGAQGYPRSPGMTTPQGGGYRGDFDYGQE
jgi:hypothetical protein